MREIRPEDIRFTPAEWDVWEAYIEGLTAPQVGERLCVSDRTVDYHMASIRKMAGCATSHAVIAKIYDLVAKPGVALPNLFCQLCGSAERLCKSPVGITSLYLCPDCAGKLAAQRKIVMK